MCLTLKLRKKAGETKPGTRFMSPAATSLTYLGIILPLAIAALTIATLKTFSVLAERRARGGRGHV
jgi:hypothetical protein